MKTTRIIVYGLSLLLVLTGWPLPLWAVENAATTGFYASTGVAPIGTFESTDRVVINGRVAENRGELWDGELLYAPAGTTAKADLRGIGQITLSSGAMVKLSSLTVTAEPEDQRRLLFATVLSGELSARLQATAGAYLIAAGRTFTVSSGASFTLTMHAGEPVITSDNGAEIQRLGRWSVSLPALSPHAEMKSAEAALHWPAINFPAATVAGSRQVSPVEADAARRAAFRRALNLSSPNAAARLYVSPLEGMIGTVETPGAMKINGRLRHGREVLWNGELIEAPEVAPVRVSLDGIGTLTIAAAASVKLSTALVRSEGTARRVLVASVISGDCVIRLQPDSGAFVQARGMILAADGGAHFRTTARDGRPVTDVSSGLVQMVGRFVIELTPSVPELMSLTAAKKNVSVPPYRVTAGTFYQIAVQPGSTRAVKLSVTNEKGQAVSGVSVNFALRSLEPDASRAIGSFGTGLLSTPTYHASTGADGTVTVPFTAGATAGSVALMASVNNQPPQQAALITSISHQRRFWQAKTAVPVLLTAAAMIAAGVTVAVTREDKLPIRGTGPTAIVP